MGKGGGGGMRWPMKGLALLSASETTYCFDTILHFSAEDNKAEPHFTGDIADRGKTGE